MRSFCECSVIRLPNGRLVDLVIGYTAVRWYGSPPILQTCVPLKVFACRRLMNRPSDQARMSLVMTAKHYQADMHSNLLVRLRNVRFLREARVDELV